MPASSRPARLVLLALATLPGLPLLLPWATYGDPSPHPFTPTVARLGVGAGALPPVLRDIDRAGATWVATQVRYASGSDQRRPDEAVTAAYDGCA